MARQLSVYLHRRFVGLLTQDDSGEIDYRYDAVWLTDPQAIPLSQSLPLREEPFSRQECTGFFGGVLPEGENRRVIARNLGITAKNDVKMLEQIGGECAGAVTFVPAEGILPAQSDRYRPLTESKLAEVLRELPKRPLLAGENHIRLSLAGAQDKLAVHLSGTQLSLPLDDAPSTHILKPALDNYEGIVLNELLCMRLAKAVDLPISPVSMGSVEGIDYLLVERYDRVHAEGQPLHRLHQEDFCQALGVFSENKYQNEGGPSVAQCFDLLRQASSVPALDILRLLDAIIYNFLIGNNDAHGKNFSLLYQAQSPTTSLAPLYDLICTAYYPSLSSKMAMKIGGEYQSERIFPYHFERLAEETGLNKTMVRNRLPVMARKILSALPTMTQEHPVSVGVAAAIRARCDRALERFQK